MADETVSVVIRGRVQGVGFRAWTAAEARTRGLSSWVRNRPDGAVEAVFRGDADAVAAMRAACHEGPRASHVTAVEEMPASGEVPDGFEIR